MVFHTQRCGFLAGYQYKTPDGFHGKTASIDSIYLDGISLTHDKPRKHIRSGTASDHECPCNTGNPDTVPTFAGNDWYCESGNPTAYVKYEFFPNDVLCDGKQCTMLETKCCTLRPLVPYFLGSATTDTVEMRLCHNEDITIESYRFFVQC